MSIFGILFGCSENLTNLSTNFRFRALIKAVKQTVEEGNECYCKKKHQPSSRSRLQKDAQVAICFNLKNKFIAVLSVSIWWT